MKVYRHMMARVGGVLLLAGLVVLGSASQADAALTVWICDDAACAGEVAIVDDLAGDSNPGDGIITVILAGGSVELASTYPFIGTPSEPVLNITYNLGGVDFASLVTPFIYAMETGFTGIGAATFEADASNGGGTATAYAGAGAFAPPGVGADIVVGPGVMDFSGSGTAPAAPYYLAIGLELTSGAGGGASGDATITVPEPATMALFGLGLLGTGIAARRRKQARSNG